MSISQISRVLHKIFIYSKMMTKSTSMKRNAYSILDFADFRAYPWNRIDESRAITTKFYPYWCQSWTDPRSWRPSCRLDWVPAAAVPSAIRPPRQDPRIRSLNEASAAPALECSREVPRRPGTLARRTDSCRAPDVTGCRKRDSSHDKERSPRTPIWNQSRFTSLMRHCLTIRHMSHVKWS